jgi:serine/threonine protein kinase
MTLAAGTTLGPYQIVAPIGAGGMGEVYRARDTKLGREVAIKVLPPALSNHADRLARFEREARVLATLNHPHIAAIYGLEERAIVMELVQGPTLADRLSAGRLPVEEALAIARQIAAALEAAHEKGIVHRDLKPANIKAPAEGPVKVLDFGLATAVQSQDGEVWDSANSPTMTMSGTQAGVILGTAAYMSPEQASGKTVDKRADIWSFGVVLWELLTGRQLFGSGETVSHTLADVLRAPITFSGLPAETPASVRELLRRCLDRDATTRLRDIGEARIVLGQPAGLSATAEPATRRASRSLWLWALLALMAAIAATVSIVHFREETPTLDLIRFAVYPPENTNLQAITQLSPDGRMLAFNTIDKDGRARLWIQPLDSLQARLIAEIGDSSSPFWSPDSKSLAYAVDGKLKKVDAASGTSTNLCDYEGAFRGGAWNREGIIIFGSSLSGLMRVSQAGGDPQPVTQLDKSRGEVGHMRPFFLPDGRHFLYYRLTANTGRSDNIFLGSLNDRPDEQSVMPLIKSDALAQYAPSSNGGSGHVLFVRDNTLLAQPFDMSTLNVFGEAVPITDGINNSVSFASFSVSGNGRLAYRMGVASRRQLTWLDRKGNAVGVVGKQQRLGYNQVSLSPDSRHAMAVSDGDIWVFELVRDSSSRLSSPEPDRSVIWSPDSQRLLFRSGLPGAVAMHIQNANGAAAAEKVPNVPSTGMDPTSWSQEGFVLCTVFDPMTLGDVWVMPSAEGKPDPGKAEPFLNGTANEGQAQFSPNGLWVAYSSNESGTLEVYVRSFPDGNIKKKISEGGGGEPRWNANSKEIFYRSAQSIMAVPVKISPGDLQPGNPVKLFDAPAFSAAVGTTTNPAWDVHPDGNRFLFPLGQTDSREPITVLLNWQLLLQR